MNINKFKSGTWKQQFHYKSFMPQSVNHAWSIDDEQLNFLLSKTDIRLGELNAFSMLIPDVDFFIRMHIKKEATISSRIEGTRTNMEEVLQKIDNINPEKRDDWNEVHNYVNAMNKAIEKLTRLPISNRLIKHAHRDLLHGVRGKDKLPGEFRNSQNWIGGSSLNDALYIPPHQNEVPELMSDLEKFLNNDTLFVPDLIKIAIAHYQFETIHPFLDGNGRIGRLLITLFLVNRGILVKPSLYLSDFFNKNKTLYYDNLMWVRSHNNLRQWLLFFLEGVRQTSESSIDTFKKIIALRNRLEQQEIIKLGKKTKSAQQFLNCLYGQPVVDSSDVVTALQVNVSTALRIIDDFIKLNILHEITGYRRNRIFIFKEYLNLFEQK
jgi:cell filamentation protein, protein adenylyltransferase